MTAEYPGQRVEGERDLPLGARSHAITTRLSNALAIALMCAFGLGVLAWYYAHTIARHDRAKEAARAAVAQRAQGDVALPDLGRIVAPPPQDYFEQEPRAARTLEEIPVAAPSADATGAAPKSAAQIEQERQLSGTVFSASEAALPATPNVGGDGNSGGAPAGDLSARLASAVAPAVRASVLPGLRLLLPKGAFIDCTLETAIDSTLPGLTTCVMATDAFGADGKVVLLERGTKLIGETRGQVQQGAARVFVLWTEARTPTGVVVPLDSPGADELGRSGLPGDVERHFWQRFGAAMLVSVIDGGVQAAAQSARGGAGTVVVNPSASQDVVTEVLRGTIAIAPTVTKRNGDRIQVLVARDLDFRSVYELRSAASR